jgi:hypothetical protein
MSGALFLLSLWAVHHFPDLSRHHFGSFVCPNPVPIVWPWTEITFFPGDLFTVRDATRTCESDFGYGTFEQRADTLFLRQIHSWSTGGCRYELMENLIMTEKRFLIRSSDTLSLEVQPLGTPNAPARDWIRLWKYGSRKEDGIR